MSVPAVPVESDPYHIGHGGPDSAATGHGAGGPAPKRIIVGYGFWIFLISDIILFSALFGAYAVLAPSTAGGPAARDIFDTNNVAWETGCLLLSSFTCGMASIAVGQRSQLWTQVALLITGLLGFVFLLLELHEFRGLVARGDGPTRSAFLTAFFTLVGCHGAHVTAGLLWLGTMMAQFYAKGFRRPIEHRYFCFSLFWHTLDIIWVAIFCLVYLVGSNL
jgi:cytochrome o ubiquinol oxidase subunit III